MKKRLLSLTLCLCLSAAVVTGCKKEESSKDSGKQEETTKEDVIAVEDDNVEALHKILMERNGDYALEHTTLADYKTLQLEVEKKVEITDEVFQEEMDALLTNNAYTFSGQVVSGQTVNIDYKGSLDGEAFEGGSAEGSDLGIGSGTFIPGFEEQLIGMSVGETKTINVTFPTSYQSTELAGKETQFEVTVNAIALDEGKSELTDQWVALYLKKNGGVITDASVDGFKSYYRNYLEETAQNLRADNEKYAVANKLIELVEVSDKVPKAQKTFYNDMVVNNVEANIENNYNMTIDEYIEKSGMTQEDYDNQITELADERMRYEYAIIYAGETEKIAPTEEEYTAVLKEYADQSGITVDEFRSQYQSSYQLELYFAAYEKNVLENLLKTASITDTTSEAVTAE